jgi:raffinose/stachyose/melibiose transport system substrate-binding protein
MDEHVSMSRRRFLRVALAGGGTLSAAALLVACGQAQAPTTTGTGDATAAPAAGTGGEATAAPAAAAEAPAATTGKKQLLLWDGYQEESSVFDDLVAKFNQANPDIEVKRESQPQMRDILRTALDAGQGPDIMNYDTGPGFAGVLARAGLLLPIDDGYAQYGWNDRVLPIAKQRATFDGKAYGIGTELEVVGMFYNKRIFQEQGLSEPKTHDEVLQAAEALKKAGLIPIAFADQDKWPAGHTFSVFSGNIAGKDKLAQAISGKVAWNDPDFVQAIQIPFEQMNQAGYFIPEINAVTYDDWNSLFFTGKAAMSLTGSWQVNAYSKQENMSDPVGFFFYPPIEGKPIAPPSGLGSGYFVSSKTKDPDAAFKFLDFMFSKETAKVYIEQLNKIAPIQHNPTDYTITDLMRFTLDVLQKDADKMGYNIDVLTPENFNTMMFDGFQEVLGGRKSAKQQADDLEKAMQDAKKENKVFDITT